MDQVPSALAGSMGKEKKPFTYLPGGLDFSEIRSPKMAKRLARHQATVTKPDGSERTMPVPAPNLPTGQQQQVIHSNGHGAAASSSRPPSFQRQRSITDALSWKDPGGGAGGSMKPVEKKSAPESEPYNPYAEEARRTREAMDRERQQREQEVQRQKVVDQMNVQQRQYETYRPMPMPGQSITISSPPPPPQTPSVPPFPAPAVVNGSSHSSAGGWTAPPPPPPPPLAPSSEPLVPPPPPPPMPVFADEEPLGFSIGGRKTMSKVNQAHESLMKEKEEKIRSAEEEKRRIEEEARLKREEEERQRREEEERQRREEEERRRREEEERYMKEMEERQRREEEERYRKEMEEQQRREEEERYRKEMEERQRREMKERQQREMEERQRREMEERQQREVEEEDRQRREAEQRRMEEERRRQFSAGEEMQKKVQFAEQQQQPAVPMEWMSEEQSRRLWEEQQDFIRRQREEAEREMMGLQPQQIMMEDEVDRQRELDRLQEEKRREEERLREQERERQELLRLQKEEEERRRQEELIRQQQQQREELQRLQREQEQERQRLNNEQIMKQESARQQPQSRPIPVRIVQQPNSVNPRRVTQTPPPMRSVPVETVRRAAATPPPKTSAGSASAQNAFFPIDTFGIRTPFSTDASFPEPLQTFFDSPDFDLDLGPMSPHSAFFKDMGTWNKINTRRGSMDARRGSMDARRGSFEAFQPQQQQAAERSIPIQVQRRDSSSGLTKPRPVSRPRPSPIQMPYEPQRVTTSDIVGPRREPPQSPSMRLLSMSYDPTAPEEPLVESVVNATEYRGERGRHMPPSSNVHRINAQKPLNSFYDQQPFAGGGINPSTVETQIPVGAEQPIQDFTDF